MKNGPDYNIFFKRSRSNDFKNNFERVIKEHSIADNSPALSLSGGIDSYIIMEYLIKTKKDFSSFTLGFENKTFDEARFVKKINKGIRKKIFYTDYQELKKIINFKNLAAYLLFLLVLLLYMIGSIKFLKAKIQWKD